MECCEGGELFDQLTNQPAGRYDVTIYALHDAHRIRALGPGLWVMGALQLLF